jgi:hypothetical protein
MACVTGPRGARAFANHAASATASTRSSCIPSHDGIYCLLSASRKFRSQHEIGIKLEALRGLNVKAVHVVVVAG